MVRLPVAITFGVEVRSYHVPIKPTAPDTGATQEFVHYQLGVGEVLFIAGPNGVGKSSLIHVIGRSFGQDSEIFSGHRQIHFTSDDTEQTGMSLQQLQVQMMQHNQASNRFRNAWSEQHLKSVVRRVLNQQAQDNDEIVSDSIETGRSTSDIALEKPRTISVINSIFADSDLAVSISLKEGMLRASRDGGEHYGIDRLSDGERAALLVVGAILVRPKNSVIAIDEPEKHLNPLISAALIARTIRARPDLSYVIASHDLNLIESTKPKNIIYVKSSEVVNLDVNSENRTFDIQVLPGNSDVPEDVRRSVLGARKSLLFVEGDHSTDYALYKNIFDNFSVVPRGGWESVAQSVKVLEASPTYHWVQAAGLIDRDGRDSSEADKLKSDKIFCIPVPTIENLYLHPAIIRIMADSIHSIYGGLSVKDRIKQADEAGRKALNKDKENIVARIVVWRANRELSSRKPSVKSIKSGLKLISGVDVGQIHLLASKEFDDKMSDNRTLRPTYQLPVKNTGVPNDVVKALGFPGFDEFRMAVVTALEARNVCGLKLRRVLAKTLPTIN